MTGILCPDCGKYISTRFPWHVCKEEGDTMNTFKKGDIVFCVDSALVSDQLTENKNYEVIDVGGKEDMVLVIDDNGDEQWALAYRFRLNEVRTILHGGKVGD